MSKKVLVISDLHLKPWIVRIAVKIMQEMNLVKAVFLGDSIDDFQKQDDIALYNEMFFIIKIFMEKYPESIFCLGNHEMSYYWQKKESGYSRKAELTVWAWLQDFRRMFGDRIVFAHKDGGVVFSHAGITESFAERIKLGEEYSVDGLIRKINGAGADILWRDDSPLWARPDSSLYVPFSNDYLQVVGHTPVIAPTIVRDRLLLCDVFSTYSDGKTPIGNQEFVIVNTEDQTWETRKGV
ncbi:MAG: metallophosphoesterase [Lachnospiraceae bacterium]|nr:metallophosphoesterase [Lachnospiraceae bacterium]